MTLSAPERVLEVAAAVVESSPADETEVTVEECEDRFVRFAESGPTQSADRERSDVAIRVRFHRSEGICEARAACGSLDPSDVRPALERALALARVSRANSALVPLGGPASVPESAPERPTSDHTFREKARWVELARELCAREGLAPYGLVQTTSLVRTLVNSAGRAVQGARSRASFSVTARPLEATAGGEGTGAAESIASNVERIDPRRVIGRAVDVAVRNRAPRSIDPGEYTVVLEPAAVSALLLFTAYQGFGAQDVEEQGSFLCGRIGEPLFSPELEIVDDAGNEHCPGFAFDGEGTPRQRVVLLSQGRLAGPVTDARFARRLGVPDTGHARPQPCADGPAPENLVVGRGDRTLEELVAGVERGLLVSQFHYTNMIEPRDLTLTGMTRNGTFWIEGGEVRHPVRNLRFTQKLVEALARVSGIGRELETAGALFDGEVVCPALRVERFRFTSTADF